MRLPNGILNSVNLPLTDHQQRDSRNCFRFGEFLGECSVSSRTPFHKSTQPHCKVSRPDDRAPRGQKNWQMSLHATASDVAIIIIIIIIIGSAERQKRRRATRGNDFSNFGSEKCSKRVISDGNDRKMRGERGESANPLKSQLSTVGGGATLALSGPHHRSVSHFSSCVNTESGALLMVRRTD